MRKLNTKGFSHHAVLAVILVVFAIGGAYMILKSNAASPAPSTQPDFILYQNYLSVSPGAGISTVTDYVNSQEGGPVTKLATGSLVTYMGKGGGNPTFTKRCYTLRATEGNAVVSLWGINSAQEVSLTDPQAAGAYNEVCLTPARKAAVFPGYNLKVMSGKVLLYNSTLTYHL